MAGAGRPYQEAWPSLGGYMGATLDFNQGSDPVSGCDLYLERSPYSCVLERTVLQLRLVIKTMKA